MNKASCHIPVATPLCHIDEALCHMEVSRMPILSLSQPTVSWGTLIHLFPQLAAEAHTKLYHAKLVAAAAIRAACI
jgi:hypothetical protein